MSNFKGEAVDACVGCELPVIDLFESRSVAEDIGERCGVGCIRLSPRSIAIRAGICVGVGEDDCVLLSV